jgi:hypothetical protein
LVTPAFRNSSYLNGCLRQRGQSTTPVSGSTRNCGTDRAMSSLPRPSAPTLAYLSAPGSISLPPPFPLDTHARSEGGVRSATRRAASSVLPAHSEQQSAGTARILVGAAAVTAAKTFVLDVKHSHWHDAGNELGGWREEGNNGGMAMLVMALCLGRLGMEVRQCLRSRKGRGRAPGVRQSNIREGAVVAVPGAAQVMAYFLAVKSVGPLRYVPSAILYALDHWGRIDQAGPASWLLSLPSLDPSSRLPCEANRCDTFICQACFYRSRYIAQLIHPDYRQLDCLPVARCTSLCICAVRWAQTAWL